MPPVNTQKQQQELFDEFVVVKKTRGRFFGVLNKFNKPIFQPHKITFSVSRESLVIALIGLVLAMCVIFSVGVERGRGLGGAVVEVPEPVQPAVAVTVPAVVTAEVPKEVAAAKASAPKQTSAENKPYTIQVASYKTRDLAEKETSKLKASGYQADIIKKGDYYVLCVGSFASKDAAKATFTAMNKKYKGCIIRKQ